MLDLKFIRENPEAIAENLKNKNVKPEIERVLELDEKRRVIIVDVETLKSIRNQASKEIAQLKKDKLDTESKISQMKEVSDRITVLDNELKDIENEMEYILLHTPNITHDSVPVGKTPEDNVVIRTWGTPKEVTHGLDHIKIGTKLGIFDFERGAKVSGGGFAFMTGKGAALERALISFFIETHLAAGYTEMMPPFIVNENSMRGTGQIPKMAEDMYHAQEDNMYLIPTAEVPLTNYYNGEILAGENLPIKFCGYSPCFRREAGSYGKDVRGFLRVHQFNKVELVKFTKPEDSMGELEALTSDAERLLQILGLPYRVLQLCSGDTSFSSAKTYDLEVWAPHEKKWLEVSSCSTFLDFQARRANIRFKRTPDSKPEFVHTLNGSGLATPRILVALLENYFDGEYLHLPPVLWKYTNFDKI